MCSGRPSNEGRLTKIIMMAEFVLHKRVITYHFWPQVVDITFENSEFPLVYGYIVGDL